MWQLRPSSSGSEVIDLDPYSPPTAAWPAAPNSETWSNKRRRQEEPGPSSAHLSQSPSELDKQRQESVATALQLYANPQEAGHHRQPLHSLPYREYGHVLPALKVGPLRGLWSASRWSSVDAGSRHSSPSIDQVKQYNSKRSRFSSLNHQKALRRSHAFHGLQQRCGDTIHFYTRSHLPNLTPCVEVFVLYVQALRPSRAPPIRCRLCHCRRIKQLMQYPPFSSPPIKGFVQKAFPHIKYSNTYLAHSLQIRATTFR